MQTVFMVTSGSYSDYRVDGVFSTREKAQEFIDLLPEGDCNGIDELPLDPLLEEARQGLNPWHVIMLRDGTTESVDERDRSRYLGREAWSKPNIWRRSERAHIGKPDALNQIVWAKDAQHAVKIVNEMRARMIAEGEWE
jgi:hypothetical protein